ncbi:MAG: HEAT repeat domain-containing protein [Oleiphilaceae bacterium]|nr:HEAT repeat domain-containing protein [Oleiphilaceae bacterium]
MSPRQWVVLGSVLALLLLALAGVVLLLPLASHWRWLALALLHGLMCLLISLVLVKALPPRYRGQARQTFAFLLTLQLAIPLLGSLGAMLGILLALNLPRKASDIPWQQVPIPELPFQPMDMQLQTVYSQGGLRQVLREAGNPDKRLQALIATRQMHPREAIDILREALKDPTDDVRLLAYSMLEQKEKQLARQGGLLQQALTRETGPQRVQTQRRLAQIRWEMAYLGLAQGGLRLYYLNQAAELLREILVTGSRHSDWRLLGRVEMALDNNLAAEDAFTAALENGAVAEQIRPYLAELAFMRRDFRAVQSHLAACQPDRLHPATRPLMEAWL